MFPFNLTYKLISFKNSLYKKGYYNVYQAGIPVISVGNINMGGSGKTPFTRYLVDLLHTIKPGIKILIVSKSYKTPLKKPSKVDLNQLKAASIFGDEPCLLQEWLKDKADVWSGPVKSQTLKAAVESKSYDLAILDDGFSHLAAHRDLDIVLFDVSRDEKHYRPLPLGFLREDFSEIARANLVVLTKVENSNPSRKENFLKLIQNYNSKILEVRSHLTVPAHLKNKNVFLFCALANPALVVSDVEAHQIKVQKNQFFADHHIYTFSDQEGLLRAAGDLPILTTEKDFVKINLPALKEKCQVIQFSFGMSADAENLLKKSLAHHIFNKVQSL